MSAFGNRSATPDSTRAHTRASTVSPIKSLTAPPMPVSKKKQWPFSPFSMVKTTVYHMTTSHVNEEEYQALIPKPIQYTLDTTDKVWDTAVHVTAASIRPIYNVTKWTSQKLLLSKNKSSQ
jgi:hypothetical protein